MRPVFRAAATTLAAALALTALPATAQQAPRREVTLAVASTFTTTDPYDANDTLSQAVAKSFYQGLFGFDRDMKLQPVLAEGYEVSPDGLVYTIRLRRGVTFHDGTAFDAAAVKANFDRVTNPDNKLKRYALYANIARTEVVDAHTARITLKKPFSAFINQLAHPSGAMISPAALQKHGRDIAFNPVGTGPFKLGEWKRSDYLRVVRNDAYWKPGLPKIDAIVWKPVADNNTRASVLQTGEAQFAFPVPYEQADLLKGKPALEVVAAPSIVHRYVSMNVQHKPFSDVRVRQAVNFAINKDAVARVAFNGYAVPAEGVVPPGVEYALKTGPWPHDPARARQLLKEAGYERGFETELWSVNNNSTAQKVLQLLQQQLGQVGIRARITALEAGQRVERVESAPDPATAGVRLYYTGWSSSTGEADWAMRPLLASESWPPTLFNTAYYKNPRVDELLARAQLTTDRAQKSGLYQEAQRIVWDDAPWAVLVTERLLYAKTRGLSGVYVMPDASFEFEQIELK